ncbi:NADH-quinone oxidoreductase subunit J [Candidatus Venteria ishoeyi]|uniref:NADH-quinone oxidoreductase subunit J n=1 Tax=Candidatus Venteria ishoeyi TaxID=1899563 RepID=A0A1H6FD77_9GAMM|nr:NADH-quinone oxidoreductase subunit J [Candidatus Venteria ishoeyi]MDM8546160.1 NADH-quinone oxidoreductase subunit J [Candidatus Venteria ishoeyi]SEH08028.1 NADH-quinone oxidoreductase subunit J [Candidatus Venteria ishoeyi]
MIKLIFYLFAGILIFAGTRVITVKNPVHAAMFLVLSFFSSAAIWLLLEAEFLAMTLVLVYVGAVMVLFLFVVMMLDINLTVLREGFARYFPVGALVGSLILIEMLLLVGPNYFGLDKFQVPDTASTVPNTVALGRVLYTEYLYAFEIAAVILLVAMVAAIALTMRSKRQNKYQDPARQVEVSAHDRLKVLKMPAEKAQ